MRQTLQRHTEDSPMLSSKTQLMRRRLLITWINRSFSERSSRYHRPRHPKAQRMGLVVKQLFGRRKDGWPSMRQMKRKQCQVLALTPCKDWNNSTLQDQNLNEDTSWRFVIELIAGIAKAFKALDWIHGYWRVRMTSHHREYSDFIPDGFPYNRTHLKCTVLSYRGHVDMQTISFPQ